MTLEECYATLHGNYCDAKTRLMSDCLIDRFVLKFPGDSSMDDLRKAIAEGDTDKAFRMCHTLKGVAANLGFTELQEAASKLTEQLRPRTEAANKDLMADLETKYQRVIDAITSYKAA